MVDIFSLIFGGGATGLLGTLASRLFNIVDKGQEYRFILAKYEADAKQAAAERENELMLAESKASFDGLAASYQHDTDFGKPAQWITNVLRLVRAAITLALWVFVWRIWLDYQVLAEQVKEFPWLQDKAAPMLEQITNTVLYCATAATLWWFGTRDMRKGK